MVGCKFLSRKSSKMFMIRDSGFLTSTCRRKFVLYIRGTSSGRSEALPLPLLLLLLRLQRSPGVRRERGLKISCRLYLHKLLLSHMHTQLAGGTLMDAEQERRHQSVQLSMLFPRLLSLRSSFFITLFHSRRRPCPCCANSR